MGTPTANKGYTVPTLNGDFGTWGNEMNANLGILDLNLGGEVAVSLAGGSVVASAAQAQNLIQFLNGTLTGNVTYTLPAVGGLYVVGNGTSGAFTVTIACAGGGASLVVPQGLFMTVICDGTNIVCANTTLSTLTVNNTLTAANTAMFSTTSTDPAAHDTPGTAITQNFISTLGTTNAGTLRVSNTGTSGFLVQFLNNVASVVGTISYSGSTTSYNTTSDKTLKIDDGKIASSAAWSVVRAIIARWFRWKDKSEKSPEPGFFAQDVHAVFPWAVHPGNGRPGDPDYCPWIMDASKLMPMVMACLQDIDQRLGEIERQKP
jgi:hypothetical protein